MKTRTIKFPNYILIVLASIMTILISHFSFASDVKDNQTNPENKTEEKTIVRTIVIDLKLGECSSLSVEPRKQYTILLSGVTFDNEVLMIGKYYTYKTGEYTPHFVLRELSSVRALNEGIRTAKFMLYTETESFGYYSLRFCKLTAEIEKGLKHFLEELEDGKKEASTVIPTCFAPVRLHLSGAQAPKVVQFDYGWSMLFEKNEEKMDGPIHMFLLNGYPGAWAMSYKEAAKSQFWSRISLSLGIGLSENEEDKRRWFLGATIPIVYDFSAVAGFSFSVGNDGSTRFSFGVKIGPELLLKVLEAMKLTKPPEL